MSYKSQILVAIIALSTIPMLIFGGIVYIQNKQFVQTTAIEKLVALHDIQKKRINDLVRHYQDKTALIASRTKLRLLVSDHETLKPEEHKLVKQILTDSMYSVNGIEKISIFTSEKSFITQVNRKVSNHDQVNTNTLVVTDYPRIKEGSDENLGIIFTETLEMEDKIIGYLEVQVAADTFLANVLEYQGFGETGESILARQVKNDRYLFLHNLRFAKMTDVNRLTKNISSELPIGQAFTSETSVIRTEVEDYRGEPVLSVMSHINDLGWGLVIKQDASEVFSRMDQTIRNFWLSLIIVIVIALVMGLIIASRFVKPIEHLRQFLEKVRGGKLNQRIYKLPKNELGQLGSTLNNMLDQLEEFNQELDNKVRERTEELHIAREKAVEASIAKSRFLANMSHEIRTPMNGVIGVIELMQSTSLDAKQAEYLKLISNSAESLLRVINDVLDISKIEAGKIELESIDYDFEDKLGDIVKSFAPNAYKKELELHYRVSNKIPRYVKGDPVKLAQIVYNLLGNALKFTNKGEISVEADVIEPSDLSSTDFIWIQICVSDSGIGIPKDKVDTIFEYFRQADDSTTREYGGSGLGLNIVDSLVDIMGGSIKVKSEVGKGTTFKLTLPLQKSTRSKNLKKIERETEGLLKNIRIIAVDDNPVNRRWLADIIELWGASGGVFSSADEGIHALRANGSDSASQYDVLLVDHQMPKKSGLDLLQQAKQEGLLMPPCIIMLSSSELPDLELNQKELNIIKYLEKPIKREDLYQVICNSLLNRPTRKTTELIDLTTHDHRSVLIVEDNRVNEIIVRTIIEQRNHITESVDNGLEAITRALSRKYDIILMDVQMPKIDGLEATKIITEFYALCHQKVIIIGVTARAFKEDKEACLASGMIDYVSKPINPKELIKKVEHNYLDEINIKNPAVDLGNDTAAKPLLDFSYAESIASSGTLLLQAMLSQLNEEVPGYIANLQYQIKRKDPSEIAKIAYQCQSALINAGSDILIQELEDICEAAREGDNVKIENIWKTTRYSLMMFLVEVKKHLGEFMANKISDS